MQRLMTTQLSSRPDQQDLQLIRAEDEECLVSFWHQATPGTTYVRCLLPARHLPGQNLQLEEEDLDWNHETDTLIMPRQRGAAVWQFIGDPWRSKVAWGQQQDFGIRVLMEVDDNYTVGCPVVPGVKSPWHKTYRESVSPGGSGYSYELHREIVPTLDGIIVSTPYLYDVYSNLAENVYLARNQVDPADWDIEFKPRDPEVLRIVYSGSQSHYYDTPFLTKAFKWAARQPGVEVWVQGIKPQGWTFAKQVPWTPSLAEYRYALGAFDVGVAPLRGGRWANAKSDLKFLEYAMAGVMPLVAREEPYREVLELFPGLGVESDERAWLDAIKRVVKHRDEVKSRAALAKKYVLEERTIDNPKNLQPWREALHGPA